MPSLDKSRLNRLRGLFGGVIVLYFIIALEVLIMISPFAAVFYAALNPVLLFFAEWPATRWLTAFFLPHMVTPPGVFLQVVRVAGSVLFVAGAIVFLICAGQVYFHKLFRPGPALGGLYRWIGTLSISAWRPPGWGWRSFGRGSSLSSCGSSWSGFTSSLRETRSGGW